MSIETITINIDDYNKMKKQITELQEQLNEESQQRLKNKECWMNVKDKYWELNKENDTLKEGIQNIIDVKDEEIKSLHDKLVVVKEENKGLVQQIHNGLNAQVEVEEENEKLKEKVDTLEHLRCRFWVEYPKLEKENEKLKEDKEELFNAWLHYWSAAQLGCEHSIPMSEQEGGKYQILLDELDF